jgi:hypothetical protein
MRTVIAAACTAVALAAAPAQATVWTLTASLDGLQEVPPVATPGTGSFLATYDDATNAMSWSLDWSGLIGTTTVAHIHGPAAVGINAGVIIGLPITPGVTAGANAGVLVFPEAQEASLLSGLTYVNVHTTFRPGGEIRGQLAAELPEPGMLGMLGLGLAALGFARRRRG